MMKNFLVMIICVALAGAVPVAADVRDDEKNPNEAKTPYHELREAVAKIRSQFSPGYNTFVDYRLAGAGRHLRLGIILGGGAWFPVEQREAGALIIAVTPGSPADEAGLRSGDVITSFNGEALVDDAEHEKTASIGAARRLVELSRDLEDGDEVVLEYVRDGSAHRVELVAREIEFDPVIVGQLREKDLGDINRFAFPHPYPGAGRWFLPSGWLDMELVALNPELGEYFGADEGVLVVRAPKEDDTLGLKSGDVILKIGKREVRSPEHAMRILRSYEPEEELTLFIIRRGRSETLTGTVPKSPINFDYGWDFKDAWVAPEE
jgi:C-terminal processing protease CtpA/Prc